MNKVKKLTSGLCAALLFALLAVGAYAETPAKADEQDWQALYQSRLEDETVNTAEEFLEIIRQINAENGWNYWLPAGSANVLENYLTELDYTPAEIKALLLQEIANPADYPNGLVAHAGLYVPQPEAQNEGDTPCPLQGCNGILLTNEVVTEKIGSQQAACVHGRDGVQDKRWQYGVYKTSHCSQCGLTQQKALTDQYWGTWVCE